MGLIHYRFSSSAKAAKGIAKPENTRLGRDRRIGDFCSFLVQWKLEVELCDEPKRLAKNFEPKVHGFAGEELIGFIEAK